MEQFKKITYPKELIGRFNSFIATEFDDSLTVEMQMRSLIKKILELIDLNNDITEYLNNFILNFDEKIYKTINDVLTKWYEDGFLEEIFGSTILNYFKEKSVFAFKTANELMSSTIEYDTKVVTFGFHKIGDGGAGVYEVVNETPNGFDILPLKNGKSAKLLDSGFITPNQLGAYYDDSVDSFDAFNYLFNTYLNGQTVRFLNDYKLDNLLVIKKPCVIIGGSHYIYTDFGIEVLSTTKDLIHLTGFKIVSKNVAKENIGLKAYQENYDWGAYIKVEDVNVSNFKIGVDAHSIFSTIWDKVYIGDCTLGLKLEGAGVNISNQNSLNNFMLLNNRIGGYFINVRHTVINNMTLEGNDYGCIIADNCLNLFFKNTWTEHQLKYPFVFGSYNIDTDVITSSNMRNPNVFIEDTRFYYERGYADSFYMGASNFTNSYTNYNRTGGYQNNIDMIMRSGLAYKNLARAEMFFTDFASGTFDTVYIPTSFGQKLVHRIRGFTGDWFGSTPITVNDGLKEGHYYLIKMKVKPNKRCVASMTLTSNVSLPTSAIVDKQSTGLISGVNTWFDFARIVKLKDDLTGYTKVAHRFQLLNFSGPLDADFCDVMIIDLTEIFGKGNEPDVNDHTLIAQYFNYIQPYMIGYTGSRQYVMSGTTDNRPSKLDLPLYSQYFDTTLNKLIFNTANGWVDALGNEI